ncbi:proline dehydrogenase family protein [Natronomonas halophila]|uniref:proline dehydrogenase family protein n=1 Tax=Natronomonas halophila TaxID=2747817 RepID=UPI0015B7239F|nr:proline dehydrogenase family protein [Natronomonas halophila]QLD85534.1 proline dehydrogenase family protein [Natronomonas halophila]
MLPPIASNFVAGEDAATAIDHVRDCNDDGVRAILNLLGEHYDKRAPADADARAYMDLIRDIDEAGVDACVSVKPSQIGLDVGDEAFRENLASIVEVGQEHDCFVWIDMEDHTTTDVTLDAFEEHALATDGDVGVCIQANLKRTAEDIERLANLPGKVRLVKGAYDEPKSVAHKGGENVDAAYRDLLEYAFEEFDDGVAVGSHDPAMLDYAADLHEEHGTPYEVQMLMGVREGAQRNLAAEGVPTYQYVPYGNKWFSYFYRRIRERKSNALFALRAVIGR